MLCVLSHLWYLTPNLQKQIIPENHNSSQWREQVIVWHPAPDDTLTTQLLCLGQESIMERGAKLLSEARGLGSQL